MYPGIQDHNPAEVTEVDQIVMAIFPAEHHRVVVVAAAEDGRVVATVESEHHVLEVVDDEDEHTVVASVDANDHCSLVPLRKKAIGSMHR